MGFEMNLRSRARLMAVTVADARAINTATADRPDVTLQSRRELSAERDQAPRECSAAVDEENAERDLLPA